MLYKSYKDDRYMIFRHKKTGEEVVLDRYRARYDRLAKGFLNKAMLGPPRFYKHITLTQREENYYPKILDPFFVRLRQRYKDIIYIWTAELQQRDVLHWHIIIGFPWDTDISVSEIKKLQSFWRYGNLDVQSIRKPSMSYLLKYVTKALSPIWSGLRRIGSSRIEAWLRQGKQYLLTAVLFFSSLNLSLDDFHWYKGSAFLYEYPQYNRGRIYIYEKPKEWEYMYSCPAELPF